MPGTKKERPVIGWREWVGLPELGIPQVKAKVDTGARSSTLHAYDIEYRNIRGKQYVLFKVHPEQRDSRKTVLCRARLNDVRPVKSSTGTTQARPIVRTTVRIGEEEHEIDLTLTSRRDMSFRMLLGREAIRGKYLVDSGRSYLSAKPPKKRKKKKKLAAASERPSRKVPRR